MTAVRGHVLAGFVAHAGGIDEMLFVVIPLLVFLALQWASRRRRDSEVPDQRRAEDHARRVRLTGGLVPQPGPPTPPAAAETDPAGEEATRPKAADPGSDTPKATG